jgi:hypothetical protein
VENELRLAAWQQQKAEAEKYKNKSVKYLAKAIIR